MACESEAAPLKTVLGIFVSIGLCLSYTPQAVLVVFLVFLISFSSNIHLSPAVQWSIQTCIGNILGVLQISLQFLCFGSIMALYYVYYPKDAKMLSRTVHEPLLADASPELDPEEQWIEDDLNNIKFRKSSLWRTSLGVLYGTLLYLSLVLVSLPLLLNFGSRSHVIWVAGVFGLLAAFTGVFQFVPQIIYTARTKQVGSLSLPMMAIQCPGSFILAFSLAIQPGANWTSWLSFFISGMLQGLLLVLCIYLLYFNQRSLERNVRKEEESEALLSGASPASTRHTKGSEETESTEFYSATSGTLPSHASQEGREDVFLDGQPGSLSSGS